MTAPRLIGLAGLKGAGKDTAAEWLCFHGYFERIALADPIKDGLAAMLGLNAYTFSEPTLKETVIDWLGCTPRHLMQTLGTEWGQRYVSRDIWTRIAQHKIDTNNRMGDAAPPIVVTDIRFAHEVEWLRGQGGQLWHIVRDWKTHYNRSSEQHISEQGVQIHPGDTVILNTGSLAQLHAQLASALKTTQ